MDINNMELLNDSGLSSLSGFSYQIKVFILRLTQLQQGQRVEFETLDDVAVRSLSSKDSISDSCFKWKVDVIIPVWIAVFFVIVLTISVFYSIGIERKIAEYIDKESNSTNQTKI